MPERPETTTRASTRMAVEPAAAARRLDRRVVLRAALITGLGLLWVSLFWLQPARQWPIWGEVWRWFDQFFLEAFGLAGQWRWVAKSALFVLIPTSVLWLLGRSPLALGLGGIADKGWRIVAVSFGVALPVLVWLGLQPGMQSYYQPMFQVGAWEQFLTGALVILLEHVFIEGVLLALALPGRGFAEAVDDLPRAGPLAFLGFGFTAGRRTLGNWLGVPDWAWPALIGQALVFGVVHFGKDLSEIVTAFPGGLGLGLLTWRVRTVWPSVALHLGTAVIILLVAYLGWLW